MLKIRNLLIATIRNASSNRVKPNKKPIIYKKYEGQAQKLRDRGFLRPQRAYDPPVPAEIKLRIDTIVNEMGGINNFEGQKFELLSKCSAAFNNHYVPNSRLYEIKSLEDVFLFYETKVDTRTPYETLDTSIPNLHVIQNYKRYNPEEDGVSAFPKSSTIISGLKSRKKYQGHQAKMSYP